MSQSTLKHPRAFMRELAQEYQIADEDEILAFLERYPEVAPLLFEIRSNIRRYFGEDSVRLAMSYDMECPEVEPVLFANIRTHLGPPEALKCLNQFDNEWWIKKLSGTSAPLVVSIHMVGRV